MSSNRMIKMMIKSSRALMMSHRIFGSGHQTSLMNSKKKMRRKTLRGTARMVRLGKISLVKKQLT